MYCEKCRVLCEGACPVCGSRKLTQPQADSPVRLATVVEPQAAQLEEKLQLGHIPYEKRHAVYPGDARPAYHFYVPYCRYQEGGALLQAVLPREEQRAVQPLPDQAPPSPGPQTYRVGKEEFEVMPRRKRIFWRTLSIVLLLLLIAAVVFATDAVAAWIKSQMA